MHVYIVRRKSYVSKTNWTIVSSRCREETKKNAYEFYWLRPSPSILAISTAFAQRIAHIHSMIYAFIMRLLINNEESIDTARVQIYKCTKGRGRRARFQKIHRVTFSLSNFVQDRPFMRGQTLGLRCGFSGRFYKIRSLLFMIFFKMYCWVKLAYCRKTYTSNLYRQQRTERHYNFKIHCTESQAWHTAAFLVTNTVLKAQPSFGDRYADV